MITKLLIGCASAVVVLCVILYHLNGKLETLEEQNITLKRTLETSLQATKDKEERNQNELERLNKQLAELTALTSECMLAPVDASTVVFLQQLQQSSAGTVSFTFAE